MSTTPSLTESTAHPSRKLIIGVTAFIAITSAAGAAALNQLKVNTPAKQAATAPTSAPAASAADEQQPDPSVMVAKLEARLKKTPNDVDGWRMLARAYMVMDRPQESVDANKHVVALAPEDADALVDLARAIGYANGRQLNQESEDLINKALKKNPGHVLGHALLGKTEMDRGQPAKAKAHWQQALANLDAQHPFAQQLRQAISAAEQREANVNTTQQGSAGTPANPAPAATSTHNAKRP